MKPSRIIILTVAIIAAGLAGFLSMRLSKPSQNEAPVQAVVQREPTVNVLVAAQNLPIGSRIAKDSLTWASWPEGTVIEQYVTQSSRPDAIAELTGSIARLPIFAGEPMRAEKLVDPNSQIMSALLPAGKRAVATEISVSTGAGGFVLPNDRVDVIMVRKSESGAFLTENVLNNVRVLAIDQQIQQTEEGSSAVVAATATLELTPEQARILVVAQQMADRISLALRSVADAQDDDLVSADYLLNGGSGQPEVQVIKSGSIVRNAQEAGR